MGSSFEKGGGNGNNDDPNKVVRFPNRAARYRDSAGFDRKGTNAKEASTLGSEDKPTDVEPLTEAECLEIAAEINEDLTSLALRHPTWDITEELIEEKVGLLLNEANNNERLLAGYLTEAATRDISKTKADVLLHLAAARAYLDILELRDREQMPEI